MTLTWDAVPGAVGYQVYVADTADGELDAGRPRAARDVLAVPHPPYVDTTGAVGVERWYAVATLSDVAVQGEPSDRVVGHPRRARRDRSGSTSTPPGTRGSWPVRGGR